MFYQYNNFTGRLIGSSHIQPYYPLGVKPLEKADPPKVVFESAKVKVAHSEPVRLASSDTSSSTKALYVTLKKKQELFQRPGDVPVFLKGGTGDKVLFGVTLVFLALGLGESFYTLFNMMRKK